MAEPWSGRNGVSRWTVYVPICLWRAGSSTGKGCKSVEPARCLGLRYAGAMRGMVIVRIALFFGCVACALPSCADTVAPTVPAGPLGVAFDSEAGSRATARPGWLRWELPQEWRRAEDQRRVLLAGAALLATDRHTVRLFDTDQADPLRTVDWTFRPFNQLADGLVLGTGLALAWGVQRGESRQTTGTALVALANSTVATTLVKGLVGKQRPDQSMEPHYRGPSLTFSSFPSGHTAAAASVAHVFARRYPRHRAWWYGFAAMVAVSRVSSAKHWLSDTAWGAGIGVLSAEGALHGDGAGLRIRF